MTDDDLRAELRRTFQTEPPPGFAARMQTHGFGAWVGHRTFSLRMVATGTAAVLLVAGVSARLVTLHWHPTSSPVAVAHSHQSPGAQATDLPTGTAPSPNASLPAAVQPSAAPSPTAATTATSAPVPQCQAADVAVRVATSAPQYAVGQTVYFTSTFTNVTAHPCGLPPCGQAYSVTDASGHVVGGDICSLPPQGAQATVLAPGTSTSLGPTQIPTGGRMGAGTYTITERWGSCKGTTTFTLVSSGGATSTPVPSATPTATATATPLVP